MEIVDCTTLARAGEAAVATATANKAARMFWLKVAGRVAQAMVRHAHTPPLPHTFQPNPFQMATVTCGSPQSKRVLETHDDSEASAGAGAPSSPPLARQWSATADPLVRIMAANKATKTLAKYGRRVMQRVLDGKEAESVPPPPIGSVVLSGLVKSKVTVPVTALTTIDDLYTAAAPHLAAGAGFKLVASGKCVVRVQYELVVVGALAVDVRAVCRVSRCGWWAGW